MEAERLERSEPISRTSPISPIGLATTLEAMVERLADHPESHLAYYDAAGQVTRKSFPEVLADVVDTRRRLASLGVRRGMRVGIFASNSYPWVVHDLALIQLGATTVPFPDETPVGELVGRFEHYGLSLLLASSDLLPPYPLQQPVIFLDRDPASSASSSSSAGSPGPVLRRGPEPPGTGGADPPSIVFSSGSSGRLKALSTDGPGSLAVLDHFCARFELFRDDLFYVFLPLHSYQTRVMVYGCINYGISMALVKTHQLLAGLRAFRPTLCLSPPLLFDSVKKQFEETLRGRSWHQRALFQVVRALSRRAPSALRSRLREACYGELLASFGGRMRLLWTGMAPVRRTTLEFFAEAGLAVLEGYGLTESGPIAMNSLAENRIGTVGRPLVPGSVQIAEDGEILVERAAFFTSRYYEPDPADPSATAATYLGPGRIATGDIGALDAEGFLHLKGRKKEIIITSGGHKVHPELIEGHLERSPRVLQAVVFGQGLPHLAAVLVVRRPEEDRSAVLAWVADVQRQLPYGIRIEKIHLTGEEFTPKNGLLTENLKVNRKAILARYRDLLLDPPERGISAAALRQNRGATG